MINLYISVGAITCLGVIAYLYYNKDNLSNTIIGIGLIFLSVGISLLHLLFRTARDIEKIKKDQKKKITKIDETLNHTYREVLGLHEKRGGLFKFIRKELKNARELERILEDEKATIELIRKENLRIREIIDKAKAKKAEENERLKIKKTLVFFPNSGRPLMEEVTLFHDWLILFLISISATTLISLISIYYTTFSFRSLNELQAVEYLWTLLPITLLIAIGMPSLNLLYLVDDQEGHCTTVKAIGHQWYWKYDYPDVPSYDSYLWRGRPYRLLDNDHRLFIPLHQSVQILITAADVLHSWTIPALAVKADAVPGRVNKLSLLFKRPGVFFGQCREICGRNHRFMPISAESHC